MVKILEKNGIGRPSTFASIISKIQDKDYVLIKNIDGEKKKIINYTLKNNKLEESKKDINIGSEKKKFVPTDIGYRVTEYLKENFTDIMDYKFTALMEDKLDDIANNKLDWINMLNKFYLPFNTKVLSLTKNEIVDEDKLLGKIDGNDTYISKTKYGDVIKMVIEGKKPQYISINDRDKDEITLEEAIKLFDEKKNNPYPKLLGEYNNSEVQLNKGKYSLYLKYNGENYNCKKEVNLEEAIKIINSVFKINGVSYNIYHGDYGPYIYYKKANKPIYVSIPKDIDPNKITAKQIKNLIKKK